MPSLSFRPLAGKADHFIINVHHGDRVILHQVAEGLYEIADVGPHDNIYRRFNRR